MKKTLFKRGERLYKANLHCHTTVSDGVLTPERIKEKYRENGYSVVAFSDHRDMRNQAHLNDENFLAVVACEVDVCQEAQDDNHAVLKTYHFNLFATDPGLPAPKLMQMKYDDLDAINAYIREMGEAGFLVCYNHPYWSLQDMRDYCGLRGLFAMEIYNHSCETEGYYGYNPQSYDEMLRENNRLFCVSTDDNHNRNPENSAIWDSFGGFTMINSESLAYRDIIAALKRGDFYASQGPELNEISLDGKRLTVKCSEVQKIVVYTDGRKYHIVNGEAITGAEIELTGLERYIRVMVHDSEKRDANSNAYWLI